MRSYRLQRRSHSGPLRDKARLYRNQSFSNTPATMRTRLIGPLTPYELARWPRRVADRRTLSMLRLPRESTWRSG